MKIHISYSDSITGDLKYATNASGSWVMSIIDSGNVGWDNSIAIDSNNKAHISYGDGATGNIKYATNASGIWATLIIDTGNAGNYIWDTSIAIDSNNKIHISYGDSNNYDLKYATNASGTWITSTIDSVGTVGWGTSIIADLNNKVHIGYYDYSNMGLKYATNASGLWVTETVDNAKIVGWDNSIALDSNNKVHISYLSYPYVPPCYGCMYMYLKYATNKSGSWAMETVDVDGVFDSMTLDSNNKVHISYVSQFTNYNLKYATNAPGSWVTEIVDNTVSVGYKTAIATDSNNMVHISYTDRNSGQLKYASNASGSWDIVTVDIAGDSYTSIALDSNDKVHISYWACNALKYATNASGLWVKEKIEGNGSGWDSSIAIDSDNKMHISYITMGSSPAIKYATNASGLWVAETVDRPWYAGSYRSFYYTSIALDSNNKVHISYFNATDNDLHYATNAYSVDLPRTGQTTSYYPGDDGDIQAGVAWPSPRFTDNGDGTITDRLTGLMWTKDASTPTVGACTGGTKTWQGALDYVACLNTNNYLGHSDWRLPNINELESLINREEFRSSDWLIGQGFTIVPNYFYFWSSNTYNASPNNAWFIDLNGHIQADPKAYGGLYMAWPVRGGILTAPIDTTPPTTTPSPAGGTYTTSQAVTLTCTDGSGSGCQTTYYCLGSGCNPTTVYSGSINISSSTDLRFYSTDNANNSESVKTEVYTITGGDTTPPVTTLSSNPTSPDGQNGWFITVPSITLTISEPGTTYYKWHYQSSWTTYTGAFNAPQGNNTLYYYSVDLAGNPELVKSAAFKVDTQPPTAPINVTATPMSSSQINLSWNASADATSGVGGYRIYNASTGVEIVTTSSTSYSFTGLTPNTTYSFYVKAYDTADNLSSQSSTASATTYQAPVSTPPGQDVSVSLGNNIEVTFTEITNPGTTSVTLSPTAPGPAPPGFSFMEIFYDIQTTASYTPPITVTLPYDESQVIGAEENLRLFHWENGAWVDVTVSVDTVNNTITGQVNSLSPFGIGYPIPAGYTTGANIHMIAVVAMVSVLMGALLIRRRKRLKQWSF